jgi:hypothetical protein
MSRTAVATLDNVERIAAPAAEVLDRRYIRTGTPVILTGLFADAPVARLSDPLVARRELGDLRLPVRANPVVELLEGRTPGVRELRFADFHDQLVSGAAAGEFCIEHDTPDEIAGYIPRPPYMDLGDPGDGWASHVFLAGAGSSTHLHFDVDKRNVLTHQVFGRKRFVIVDARETRKLAPGSPPEVCYASALYLEHFSPADLVAFLRYVDAWDCVLEPGETLLTPATAWHYIEYVDVALSVTLRLARNRYLRFLAETAPMPSVELQAFASLFRDDSRVGPEAAAAFAEFVAAANRRYRSWDLRAATLDRLCVELCARLGLPIAGAAYHLDDIARRQAMSATTLTTPPRPGRRAGRGSRASLRRSQ